LNLSTDTES